jgi:hypothetical protein
MSLEGVTATLLFARRPADAAAAFRINALLLFAIWISTAFLPVPAPRRLAHHCGQRGHTMRAQVDHSAIT